MNSTETAERLADLAWQQCRYETYLYSSCVELEAPSSNLKVVRAITEQADWQQHFVRGLLSTAPADFESLSQQTPVRCTLLMQALNSLLSELSQDELDELLSKEQIAFFEQLNKFVETHVWQKARRAIIDVALMDEDEVMPRYASRLILHMVPSELIAERFAHVKEIDLGEEIFCAQATPKLKFFSGLEIVLLDGSDVLDEDVEVLSALKNLRLVDLSKTGCGNFSLQPLLACKKLEELHIQSAAMDDGIVYFVSQMKSLKKLWVDSMPDAVMKQLTSSLPACEIVSV